jgi:3-oxoacyl-[acyl-carrier protein] reductase
MVLPRMLERGSGKIINVASQLGQIGGTEMVHYSASKAGVIGLTKALAREVSTKGVRVNAIAPGFISTELNREYLAGEGAKMTRDIPAGRFGEERDLDGALLLLVSDAAAYMAGATIVVDGGHMLALRGT